MREKVLCDSTHFSEDVTLEIALFAAHKLKESLSEGVELVNGGAVFDDDRDGLGQCTGTTLVQNERVR